MFKQENIKLISDVNAEKLNADTQAQARAYLSNTDWYVTREAEGGSLIPPEVKTTRQKARDVLDSAPPQESDLFT